MLAPERVSRSFSTIHPHDLNIARGRTLEPGDSLLENVREEIASQLHNGRVSLRNVALKLDVSPRTLQRRLAEAWTSFNQLLDDVRQKIALQLLAERRHSMIAIALHLGYNDPGSFSRAFRRWTGNSPRRYRACESKKRNASAERDLS